MAARNTTFFAFLLTAIFVNMAIGNTTANDVLSASPAPSAPSGRVELAQYIIAKPASAEIVYDSGDIYPVLPLFARQSQFTQPVVIRNYYLTAEAKQEILPFWQDAKPLRLRNQFLK